MIYLLLRWLLAAAASAVVLAAGRRAWRAMRRPERGDMIFLIFVGLAVSRLVLVGRGLAYPNAPASQVEAALTVTGYLIGIAGELGVLVLLHWGREDG